VLTKVFYSFNLTKKQECWYIYVHCQVIDCRTIHCCLLQV